MTLPSHPVVQGGQDPSGNAGTTPAVGITGIAGAAAAGGTPEITGGAATTGAPGCIAG